MRRLDGKEVGKCQKGISMREKQMKDAQDTIEYNKWTVRFLRAKRDYEDYTRPRSRKAQDDEVVQSNKVAEQTIAECKDVIKELNRQITIGVEEKNEKEK